jgi:signal peptidase I
MPESTSVRIRARRLTVAAAAIVGLLAVRSSSVGVCRAVGPSDAPTILWGDLVVVNRAAYDLRVPFYGRCIGRWADPQPGEVVVFQVPGQKRLAFKRVVAGPGQTVELRGARLVVDGKPARYHALRRSPFERIPERNRLGTRVEWEDAGTFAHLVTLTPALPESLRGRETRVPANHYMVLGDNRDHSYDSRSFGPVPRAAIVGRVIGGRRWLDR